MAAGLRLTMLLEIGAPASEPALPDLSEVLEGSPTTPRQAWDVIGEQLADIWRGLLESLPAIGLGLVLLAVALLAATAATRALHRTLRRTRADRVAVGMVTRLTRLVLIFVALLFALSVMGVPVGSVLGGLAVAGIVVGLAVQAILENFIAGVILLLRKPFRAGDQIRTGDFEGTVDDIDLRVTRLVSYEGETILVPNSDVYRNPLTNLTRRGSRRTTVVVGIDYRDDHDAAREVLRDAVVGVDGVLLDPAPEVLFTALGDSSVEFEVRWWTLPDIRTVRAVQDRVLSSCKRAVEQAGMTIPWPIRTLVVDGAVRVDADAGGVRSPDQP